MFANKSHVFNKIIKSQPQKLFKNWHTLNLLNVYPITNKNELTIHKKISKLWIDIFDYHRIKTNSDIDALIEIYQIFEKSLKII